MSRPATRVLTLLEILQDRGLVTAAELADRLDVDPRSVRRYVTALHDLGIPVRSVRGRYGGYRLAPGYRLPPLMLSDDEAVAVAVALSGAGEGQSAASPSAVDRALVKLTRVLPAPLRERVNAVLSATGVLDHARRPVVTDPEVVLALGAAVRAHRRVRIDHTRPGGERTTRAVDPYGLVVHAGRWYLVAHDHLRDDLRTYRVDRIGSVAELPGRFSPPADVDAVAHVRHSLTLGAWTHRTEVWLDTDADSARRHLPTTAGEIHADPRGGVVLVSGVENLAGMARMLAGLPWRFSVRHPAELVVAVDAHVAGLMESAARSHR
ncbi:MAG TPA: YafY family protein [Acidimicrobiales bacterium]